MMGVKTCCVGTSSNHSVWYFFHSLAQVFWNGNYDSHPTANAIPVNIVHKSTHEIKEYFDTTICQFVQEFIFQTNQAPKPGEEIDSVKNYSLCNIFLTLVIMQLKDTAAEGDGDRNIINQKLLFSIFKSLNSYSKYALEMFVSIAQFECLLT